MARGRTLYEIITGQGKPDPAGGPYNPLGAKVGQRAQVDVLDFRDDLWAVAEVWAWDAQVGRAHHPMADYVLESDGKRCLLRAVPRKAVAGPPVSVLLMTQYWPEGPGPAAWTAETPAILQALDDSTGEFYKGRGTDAEECYWRVGGAVPVEAEVCVADRITDTEGDRFARGPMTFWDFHRETKDEGGNVIVQYLYAQLSGRYRSPERVEGGDKMLVMYRGVEIDPKRITLYGGDR